MVYTILDRIIQAFQEPRNRERIQTQCIDPLLKYILNRMFPYIILICIIFSIILLMSFTSVGLLMLQLYANSKPMDSLMAMASPMPMAMPMAAPMASPAPMAVAALADSLLNNSS
jgi:hypothetical protein